jgi:DNA-binding Lrp family transcriptional regulator
LADTNTQIAEMVKLITQIGPDLAEVSRRLGIFKETVRYRYKGLIEKGFAVQVAPNYERMGLQRMISTIDFSLEFRQYAEAILTSMSQLCYLSSYAKNVPSGSYTVHFNIPREHVEEVIELLNALKGKGMFRSVGTYTFDSYRNIPMKADQFNFDNGVWDYEWSSTHKPYPENVIYEKPSQHKLDEIDLKIIEQLQYDANKSFTEIQEKLGVNYKTLTWHFRNHIMDNGLVKGYKVNWMGTRYDFKIEKAMSRKHKYAFVELLVKDVTQEERMQLMGRINSMPFVWAEAVGANYYAQMPFPTEMIAEGLTFLEELLAPVLEKAQWSITDSTHALWFTVEPALYDSETRTWKFQMSDLVARFDSLLLQIRGTAEQVSGREGLKP